MVNSNKGRSVHDETQGYDDSQRVEDVGLDSNGFPQGFNPKEVTGSDESDGNYQDPNYEHQDEVREWDTQGQFGPDEKVSEVFSNLMDSPEETLNEDHELVTDGGQDVYQGGLYEESDTL
ncbi:MAG: hypothetical protein V5A72_00305 [Candidatus Nanohaloarchaea archaeon]